MTFPNPGYSPSVIRLRAGEIFSLEGQEGLNVSTLLISGIIREYLEPKPAKGKKAVSDE